MLRIGPIDPVIQHFVYTKTSYQSVIRSVMKFIEKYSLQRGNINCNAKIHSSTSSSTNSKEWGLVKSTRVTFTRNLTLKTHWTIIQ